MLDLSPILSELKNTTAEDFTQLAPRIAIGLENVQDAINQTALVSGVDSTTHLDPPDPPAALNVKVANNGELVHLTVEDNSSRDRARTYFIEHSANDPAFSQPFVHQLGAGRDLKLNLPTFLDDGVTVQDHYFRTYSMNPGSKTASPHVYYGDVYSPVAVNCNGTTAMTLLPSTGAGTAPSNGQKAGHGFGRDQSVDRSK